MKSLVSELISAANTSCDQLREEIDNVRYDRIRNDIQYITFTFRGTPYRGMLIGRNLDLLLGFGQEQDKAIALRVMLDNCAEEIKPE